MAPVWVPPAAVRAIHSELMREFGGLPGPSNVAALDSTLARPAQLLSYSEGSPSISRLAAAYGYGLAKNHCFPDGNKRLALATIDVFLQLNGRDLSANETDSVLAMQALAAGQLSEDELAGWIEANSIVL